MSTNDTQTTKPASTLPITLADNSITTVYFWKQLAENTNLQTPTSTTYIVGPVLNGASELSLKNKIEQGAKQPLKPKAQSTYKILKGDTSIQFEVTVYITGDANLEDNEIYKKLNLYINDISNTKNLDVLVSYDAPEESKVLNLYPYKLMLEIDTISQTINGVTSSLNFENIRTITTYLHDIDPITSRGTVTTVKKTTEVGDF
ncbi:hypothetical protein [Kordia sp.]|uniref:hypothetical protein n=1 Tax=Kordia sp. TaxID=1965332 RepID=UPI003D6BC55C